MFGICRARVRLQVELARARRRAFAIGIPAAADPEPADPADPPWRATSPITCHHASSSSRTNSSVPFRDLLPPLPAPLRADPRVPTVTAALAALRDDPPDLVILGILADGERGADRLAEIRRAAATSRSSSFPARSTSTPSSARWRAASVLTSSSKNPSPSTASENRRPRPGQIRHQ
ncbi:MAG: hypothetical protein R3F11_06490 [Verrucomicrobiales bacterium]